MRRLLTILLEIAKMREERIEIWAEEGSWRNCLKSWKSERE